jgi:thiol:disulfide interchange protein DsbD
MKPWMAALAVALGVAGAAHAAPVSTGHVQVELVAASTAAPGRTIQVALRQKITPGWHTYWRNPGSAGQATELGWRLPAGWKAGAMTWPAPERLLLQTLMNYGYENEVLLPVSIAVPASAKPGATARLAATVRLLVCKDQCIPEHADIQLSVPVTKTPAADPRWGGPIGQAISGAPRPAGLTAVWSMAGQSLKLAVTGNALATGRLGGVYFYPYATDVIDHDAVQRTERGSQGVTLTLKPGYALTHGPRPAVISGVLEAGGKTYEITARKGALPASARGMGQIAAIGPGSSGGPGASAAGAIGSGGGSFGLPLALGFAFLGGVVLNLMPCVFPILSMKALALARHGEDPGAARTGALAFTAGVLATFLGLALVLIAAKAAGAQVGWGFQLQSPLVVAGLALLMLLIGLNLSGVFEAGLSLQSAGGSVPGSGPAASFLTGALAVVVAAPCTAPFMAGAIGYALTQSAGVALAVFAALALGFAAPFLALTLIPALARRLPRPGGWMEGLRKVLAFPMYGAAAWLLWVLTIQAGTTAMAAVLASGVALALAAWLYGAGQRARIGGRRALPAYGISGLAALAAVTLAVGGSRAPAAQASPMSSGTLQAEAFTPTKVEELRAQGRPVFVDFTAAWCVTCQVNERVALFTAPVQAAFRRTNAAYVKADWTRQDPVIAEALAARGRAGVPLYLVYAKSGGEPEVLPQLLSQATVIRALDKAAQS